MTKQVNALDYGENPWDIFEDRQDGGDKNDWLYLEPKPEHGHDYTLIFIHGLFASSSWSLKHFVPYDENYLVPKNTKVILPASPKDQAVFQNDYSLGLIRGNSWFHMNDII
jgi:hypothetical protein